MDFETIYRTYFKDVFLFMRGLASDKHIAEEITQETFVKALKSIGSFDGSKDIRAWLFTIARNSYYSYCRKQKRIIELTDEKETENTGVSFTEDIENSEQAFLIHSFIHKMSEPYKEVFSLRVMGELPFEKIGSIFGKSAGWARVTFYRAKKQIINQMEEQNHE